MRRLAACLGVVGLALMPSCTGGPPAADITYGTIKLVLRADQAVYHTDGSANLTLHVEYTGQEAGELQFLTGQSFDFRVTREGQDIWQWSYGRFFTQAIRMVPMPAGWSQDFTAKWDLVDDNAQPVPPGTYEITAELALRDRLRSMPIAVRVE